MVSIVLTVLPCLSVSIVLVETGLPFPMPIPPGHNIGGNIHPTKTTPKTQIKPMIIGRVFCKLSHLIF